MSLRTERPDLYLRLLGMIHMLTDKKISDVIEQQEMFIDWDEIARAMKGDVWEVPPVIKPVPPPTIVPAPKPSRFDGQLHTTPFQHIAQAEAAALDQAAPVLRQLDAPKSLSEIRSELNDLIRANGEGTLVAGLSGRILGILEQILMKLESGPTWTFVPSIPSGPIIPPVLPAGGTPQTWPPYSPYVGDPPFPGSSTICSASTDKRAAQAMSQADGHADHPHYDRSMGTGVKNEDFPF